MFGLLLTLLCILEGSHCSIPIPLLQSDWHYPPEEKQEMRSLTIPTVKSIDVSGDKATLYDPKSSKTVTATVGDEVFDEWTLVGVVEYHGSVIVQHLFANWGVLVYVFLAGPVPPHSAETSNRQPLILRKSVGTLETLKQPTFNFTRYVPKYFQQATSNTDYIGQLLQQAGPNFINAASLMAPNREYGVIGNAESCVAKWMVCDNGRIKEAQHAFAEADSNLAPPVFSSQVMVFDSKKYLEYFPAEFTDTKVGLVGGYLRLVDVGNYDTKVAQGFEQLSFGSLSDTLRIRLRQKTSKGYGPYVYYHVEGGTTTVVDDTNGEAFYYEMLNYVTYWQTRLKSAFVTNAPYEERRLQDMSLGSILSSETVYCNLAPNYGTGYNYWSVKVSRGGSLPLTTLALNNALLDWSLVHHAEQYVQFYLHNFIEGNGNINMSHWGPCGTGSGFPDSYSDFGRLMDLYVKTVYARDSIGSAFYNQTIDRALLMSSRLMYLISNSNRSGLLYGPPEHDNCRDYETWFSINVWAVRGLKQFADMLLLYDSNPSNKKLADEMIDTSNTLKKNVIAAANKYVVKKDGKDWFLPPYPTTAVTPFDNMTQDRLAEYTNFRYWSETMFAGVLPTQIQSAMLTYRQAHGGMVSGNSRFEVYDTQELDNMPALGYAWTYLSLDRLPEFWTAFYGHIANYQSRGVFHSTEQLGLYGQGKYRSNVIEWPKAPQHGWERDIDFCVPSQTIVASMYRWMWIYDKWDNDTIWLGRGIPPSWWTQEGTYSCDNGSTRFGSVGWQWNIFFEKGIAVTTITVTLGNSNVVNGNLNIQVRVPLGEDGKYSVSKTGCSSGCSSVKQLNKIAVFSLTPTSTSITFWVNWKSASLEAQ